MAKITKQELIELTEINPAILSDYKDLDGFETTLTVEGRGNLRMGHLGIANMSNPHTHYLPEMPTFLVLIGKEWVKTCPKMNEVYKNALNN